MLQKQTVVKRGNEDRALTKQLKRHTFPENIIVGETEKEFSFPTWKSDTGDVEEIVSTTMEADVKQKVFCAKLYTCTYFSTYYVTN